MAIFDTSFLNPQINCINDGKPDPETGCVACGENARSVYEQCRQTYYLKKQTEINTTTQDKNDITVSSLEKDNTNLRSELTTQIDANNQIKAEHSNYYHLTGLTLVLIILIAVIAGYMVHFFTRRP